MAMWPPEDERFDDRDHAGQALGAAISAHLDQIPDLDLHATTPLVMALPRGGTPVGFQVAKAIGADFDLVMAGKIGLPWQPDYGVGGLAEDGPPVFDHDALACVGLSVADLAPAV